MTTSGRTGRSASQRRLEYGVLLRCSNRCADGGGLAVFVARGGRTRPDGQRTRALGRRVGGRDGPARRRGTARPMEGGA